MARTSFGNDSFAVLRPVVEDHRVEIGAVRPFDRAGVGIDAHLGEQRFIAQSAPQGAKKEWLEVNHSLAAIVKCQAKTIAPAGRAGNAREYGRRMAWAFCFLVWHRPAIFCTGSSLMRRCRFASGSALPNLTSNPDRNLANPPSPERMH